MTRRAILTCSSALLLAAASLPASAEKPWKAVASSGAVEARHPELATSGWNAVRRGQALPPATLVRTGDDGRATLTRKNSLIVLEPRTELELPDADGGVESRVVQSAGTVLYEVDGRKEKHFEVVTPYLVAGVKGTRFRVTVTDLSAELSVDEGLVEVFDPLSGRVHEVGAGASVLRERGRERMHFFESDERRIASRVLRGGRMEAAGIEPEDGGVLGEIAGYGREETSSRWDDSTWTADGTFDADAMDDYNDAVCETGDCGDSWGSGWWTWWWWWWSVGGGAGDDSTAAATTPDLGIPGAEDRDESDALRDVMRRSRERDPEREMDRRVRRERRQPRGR